MRIRFLTNTIEPGRNGIGDYTLRLASDCERRGHATEIVAFRDRHAEAVLGAENTLRLPKDLSPEARLQEFAKWQGGRSGPDWASLQFVPYGFDDKGFVGGWTAPLLEMMAGAKRHVMFHEIWIGQENSAPLRHRAIGAIQKWQIMRLLKSLAPRVAHTSNEFYAGLLGENGCPAKVLPLAANIEVHPRFDAAEREGFLNKLGIANRQDVCLAGTFGALYPEWNPEPILHAMRDSAARHGKKLVVISCGRIGAGEPVWDRIRAVEGISSARLGELPPAQISAILQELDAGFCASTYELRGKSSATATMLEHGLPVIVSRFENTPEPASPPQGFVTPSNLDRIFKGEKPGPRDPGATVGQFLADLEAVR